MASGLFNLKQVNQAISQGAWSGYIAPRWVEYLVVAGGGSGGRDQGGGGGAGGLLTGIVTVATGASYTVTIGAGGAGITSGAGNTGVSSVFGSITTLGGGGGGAYTSPASSTNIGKDGGSGGGGGGSAGAYQPGGNGTAGQGNAGGRANNNNTFGGGGGGGGAGTVGLDAINATSTPGGNGGAGIASAITGTVVTYAGGGGGNKYDYPPGAGGVGGGGSASNSLTVAGGNGATNTGGGGGGIWNNGGSYPSGSGGSGIVVVRYPGNVQFYTGGTVTYSNGYIVHNFTANGTLAPTTPTVVSEYQISRSLRFNSADTAYLSRTPASAGNRKTWTWSAWIKRGSVSSNVTLFSGGVGGFGRLCVIIENGYLISDVGGTGIYDQSTAVYRDPSAWYHFVWQFDTTQATAANRSRMYINGVEVALTKTRTFTQNTDYEINNNVLQTIGTFSNATGTYNFDGYQTEVNFIDGQALPPTSFGYVNPSTGVWSPAKYVGGYGTNGFYLNFSNNSNTTAATLGADYSGNGNNWTPNGFLVSAGVNNDSLVDSPTSYGTDTGVGGEVRGNYGTFNPLNTTGGTISNGNLSYSFANFIATVTMAAPTSGKWYWETTVTSLSGAAGFALGIYDPSNTNQTVGVNFFGAGVAGVAYYSDGSKYVSGVGTAYGASFGTNDIIGVALNADSGTVAFYKNNTSQGSITLPSSVGGWVFEAQAGGGSNVAVIELNMGQRAFSYTAPSGFKALCTQNLPTPTIGATSATLAGKFFAPVLYTGTGSSQSITGVGFQPDWVWIKSRSAATSNSLYDAVRGVQKELVSNNAGDQVTEATSLTAFGSDGFTVGALARLNTSAATYVAWNWKANGAGSTNTAGSITSTVSASTASGFSVVTYTGTGGNATIGHGLGVAPQLIFVKGRDTSTADWFVYTSTQAATKFLILNTTAAVGTDASAWNSTAPTSTVFSVGGAYSTSWSAKTYVAYCFAPVAGYSAFGSYTGNGSADGPFVYTGFRPAYLLVKNATSTGDWIVVDAKRNTYNMMDSGLQPNGAYAEASNSNYRFDFLSNGFKVRTTNFEANQSGNTIIFMAFASNPFKYSLAR
jgi:hypothetical protein